MSRQFKITVNGVDYQVAVEELGVGAPVAAPAPAFITAAPVAAAPAPAPVAAPAAVAAAPAGAGDEVAQMGGVVAQIYVNQGQSVNIGDRLLDLEAMKMMIPLTASRSGQVTRILVAQGDAVDGGQALLTIA